MNKEGNKGKMNEADGWMENKGGRATWGGGVKVEKQSGEEKIESGAQGGWCDCKVGN